MHEFSSWISQYPVCIRQTENSTSCWCFIFLLTFSVILVCWRLRSKHFRTTQNPHQAKSDGKIEGFYVGYRELGNVEAFTFKTFEALASAEQQSHRLTYELTGLRRSTEYAVTVQAFNGKGAGPQSEVVRIRTFDFGKFHFDQLWDQPFYAWDFKTLSISLIVSLMCLIL